MATEVEVRKQILLNAIEKKEKDIANLHEEIDKLEKQKLHDAATQEVKMLYDSYIRAGFDEDQAFDLVMETIKGIFKTNSLSLRFGR